MSDVYPNYIKDLYLNDNTFNNFVIWLIHMPSNEVVKRVLKGKKIFTNPAVKHRKLVKYNKPLLSSYTEVRYLLKLEELEWKRYRVTDINWFLETFIIDSYLIKNDQLVLFKLYNGPKHFFIKEHLQIVSPDTILPPKYIFKH